MLDVIDYAIITGPRSGYIPPSVKCDAVNTSLPMAGTEPERSDAARNRQLLLDAAAALVAEHGVDAVSMERVATRAGVGKGTVFRRFGSRAGLMSALLDHSEHEFQHSFLFGPPPLGPGAGPVERLVAFGCARIDTLDTRGELLRAAEAPSGSRFANPPRRIDLLHIETLLRLLHPGADVTLLAHSLTATLDANLVLHQLRELGYTPRSLADHWTELVHLVAVPRHNSPQ